MAINEKRTDSILAGFLGSLFPGQMAELVRGAGLAFILKVLSAGLSFLFNLTIARILGAEGAGIYFLALTIVMFAAVLGRGGLDGVVLRHVAADATAGAWDQVKRLYNRSMLTCILLSGMAALLVATLAEIIAVYIFSKPELTEPLRWMSLAIVPLALVTLHSEILRGLKKIAASLSVLGLGVPAFSLAGLLVAGRAMGVMAAVWAYIGAAVLMTGMGFLLWHKYTSGKKDVTSTGFDRPLASAAAPLLLVALTQLVLDWFSTFIVGVYSGKADVGIYHVAMRTASLIRFVLVSVNVIAAPIFASLYSQNKMSELESVARKSVALILVSSAPILILLMIFPGWVMGLFGDRFADGAVILVIIAVSQFVNSATGSVGCLLIMTGNERVLRNITVIVAILTVTLNISLVPNFGTTGAAIATASCLSLHNIICFIYVKLRLGIWVIPSLPRISSSVK